MSNQDFVIHNGVLIEYKGAGGDVVIPEGIKAIGWHAFRKCISLTGVTIPEGVEIERDAFKNCFNLKTVTIPEGVRIGEGAFKNTPWLKELGEFAIVNQTLLRYQGSGGDVIIPEQVKTIRAGAFMGCKNLTTVTIPKGIKKIAWNTFRGCINLTTVTIPEGVEQIGGSAFEDCMSLTTITIPKGVKEIGINAFYCCTGLKSVTIPEGVTKIGDYAFSNCESLTNVIIPEGVEQIGGYAFSGCTDLKTVSIPMQKIDASWFEGHLVFTLMTPPIPIEEFVPEYRPSACCGFAQAWLEGKPMEQEIRAGYLNYIKKQKKQLYPAAFQHQQLLWLMIAEKMIPRQDIDLLLEECDKQKNFAAKAALLEYAGKNLKPVDPMREFRL